MTILLIVLAYPVLANDASIQLESTGLINDLTTATGLSLGSLITVAISLLEAIIRMLPTKKNYSVLKIAISIIEKILNGIKAVESVIPNNGVNVNVKE